MCILSAIRYTAFRHPWFYHYYVHTEKSNLYTPSELHCFLESMFANCPHHKFLSGPRSSALKKSTGVTLIEVPNNDVCRLASEGLAWDMQGTAHGNVQLYMLQNDEKTIGVEIPVWLDQEEYEKLGIVMPQKGAMTGHIDVLRIEEDKIWIWDFKPKAEKEKFADMQVMMYAFMLSQRINLPIDHFMCGYFDQHTSYIFKPELKLLKPLIKQSNLEQFE